MSFVHKEQLSPSSLYQIGPLFSILVVHPSLGRGVGEGGGAPPAPGAFSLCTTQSMCTRGILFMKADPILLTGI